MCDDSGAGGDHGAPYDALTQQFLASTPSDGLSRRRFLQGGLLGAGIVAAGAVLPGHALATPRPQQTGAAGLDGATSFRTAQHIHARGSEGPGSMTAQAAEAAKWVDVLWFTDHDWREAGIGAPSVVHFNSLTAEKLGPNPPWTWTTHLSGTLDSSSKGGIDTTHVSPNDPDPRGALYARAVSSDGNPASFVWYADDSKLRNSSRTPSYGQQWSVDVLLREASRHAYGLARVALSYHPASGGRANAYYFLEYRFGPFAQKSYGLEQLDPSFLSGGGDGGDGTIHLFPGEQALLGVVYVPQQVGSWVTHTLTFTDDITALFPDMIARDNSIRSIWFGATSANGDPATANFDYLRMTRVLGQAQFDDRKKIANALGTQFPDLTIYNGTEVSYGTAHRHWLGGQVTLPSYDNTRKAQGGPTPTLPEIVRTITQAGGLPVANHPFGTNGKKLTDTEAAAAARDYVQELLSTNAEGGLKAIEVFYRMRAGATLEHHWRLYRMTVRNGLVLTATGVSDNHWGRVGGWSTETNHFATSLYASGVDESSLLDAQARGRAYCFEINSYSGQLDLSLDEDVMGQIGIRRRRKTRTLTIMATGLAAEASVEVWAIPVDLGGLDTEPGGVLTTLPSSAFRNGTASITVDTAKDTAFAAMVVSKKGRRVAGTNPVWHLTQQPSWAIPADRLAS